MAANVVPKVSITRSEVIAIVERGGDKAMKADIEMNGAKSGYTIKLIQRSKLHRTWVDGAKRPLSTNSPAERPN